MPGQNPHPQPETLALPGGALLYGGHILYFSGVTITTTSESSLVTRYALTEAWSDTVNGTGSLALQLVSAEVAKYSNAGIEIAEIEGNATPVITKTSLRDHVLEMPDWRDKSHRSRSGRASAFWTQLCQKLPDSDSLEWQQLLEGSSDQPALGFNDQGKLTYIPLSRYSDFVHLVAPRLTPEAYYILYNHHDTLRALQDKGALPQSIPKPAKQKPTSEKQFNSPLVDTALINGQEIPIVTNETFGRFMITLKRYEGNFVRARSIATQFWGQLSREIQGHADLLQAVQDGDQDAIPITNDNGRLRYLPLAAFELLATEILREPKGRLLFKRVLRTMLRHLKKEGLAATLPPAGQNTTTQ